MYSNSKQLSSIKQQVDQMVERKWAPYCQEQNREPLDVWTTETSVCVGHVNHSPGILLKNDVMLELESGYQNVFLWPDEETEKKFVEITPIPETKFYEVSEGTDARRAALVMALDETEVKVPHMDGKNRLAFYETRDEAQQVVAALEDPLKAYYNKMAGETLKGIDIREYVECREWLSTESFYEIVIGFR